MALVHMDVYSSLVTSIEGYKYTLIITNSCSEHLWQYRMKTKDKRLAMLKRWIAKLENGRYPEGSSSIGFNAGVNTSKDLNNYFSGC
jgi:hypothetical protein